MTNEEFKESMMAHLDRLIENMEPGNEVLNANIVVMGTKEFTVTNYNPKNSTAEYRRLSHLFHSFVQGAVTANEEVIKQFVLEYSKLSGGVSDTVSVIPVTDSADIDEIVQAIVSAAEKYKDINNSNKEES